MVFGSVVSGLVTSVTDSEISRVVFRNNETRFFGQSRTRKATNGTRALV